MTNRVCDTRYWHLLRLKTKRLFVSLFIHLSVSRITQPVQIFRKRKPYEL